ncbi:MAG: hypothetical protein RMI91_12615 [Gemmatales bacterium]|nr:hypothetical protein [Gemmatales bacterium]MDW7995485.1 hypothetical protein [Gemmatales bacterium]
MINKHLPRFFLKSAVGREHTTYPLVAFRPAYFRTYHEPSLGSGALFLHLYRENLVSQAVLSDIDAALIDT